MSDGSRKFGSDSANHRPSEHKTGLIDRLKSLVGLGGASVRDDIEDALDDSTTETDFSPQERTMLKNVLGLHELRVEDLMVPRADIIAVQSSATLREVLTMFRTAGHSRLPVYNETLDDPRGMVHIRDFLDHLATAAEVGSKARRRPAPDQPQVGALDLSVPLSSAKVLRPVLFVPPSMPALDLLIKMQASRTHMALVIDEYGGTDGLVSIEDIVETIVGDIEDEHDEAEGPNFNVTADGTIIANARATLEEVSTALGRPIADLEEAEEVDTLGGLVTSLAGRVPVRGEIVAGDDGIEFEILDADPRRIKRLRISRRDPNLPAPPPRAKAAQEHKSAVTTLATVKTSVKTAPEPPQTSPIPPENH